MASFRLITGVVLTALVMLAGIWWITPDGHGTRERVSTQLRAHRATELRSISGTDRTVQALIATENSRFFGQRYGLDPLGAVKPLISPILGRGDQGGSTIDQQLAKLAYPDEAQGALGPARVIVLAMKNDQIYTRHQILLMYVNVAYFGHGHYGLADAARGYFGREADQLSWAQASLLAGLVQAPSRYDPLLYLGRARTRQAHVLDRLVDTGTLTEAEASVVRSAPLGLRRRAA
ncbi:MAG: monofunctional glycosyltransferase [Actinomycetota bacterium]|nr:monofunctional glycosyltransferase [Actinomycetota bacterium]